MLEPLFTPGKTRYPLCRSLGGSQGRSGQVRENSPPTGIRSPDRPARSQSLYRLSYPVHVRLKALNNLRTAERIFMKSDTEISYEKLLSISILVKKWTNMADTLHGFLHPS